MAPKPTLSELRADAAADAKMEGAVEAQTEAQLMQSYPKAMHEKPAGTILRDAMDAVKSTIAAGVRPISPRAAPPGSSKDVDDMSDGSFEKVEDDVVMVTEADYDLAEKVATQHKNDEDSAALELAGQTTEDFTFLAEASHLDVQKSLADLEEAIAKLSTKDTEETKVSEESSTLPGPAQGDQGEGSVSKDTFVAFDRTPDGSYKITNTATDWPLVPGHIRSKLRNFTIGELYDLMSIFKGATSLTESTFHRILEVYALQVMKLQHTHILEADHVRKRDASVVLKTCRFQGRNGRWGLSTAQALALHSSVDPWCLTRGADMVRNFGSWVQFVSSQLMGSNGLWRQAPRDQCGSQRKGKASPQSSSKRSRGMPPSMQGIWSPLTQTRSLLVNDSLWGRWSPPMSSWMMPNFKALSWGTGHQSAQISKTGNRLSSFIPKLQKPYASKSNWRKHPLRRRRRWSRRWPRKRRASRPLQPCRKVPMKFLSQRPVALRSCDAWTWASLRATSNGSMRHQRAPGTHGPNSPWPRLAWQRPKSPTASGRKNIGAGPLLWSPSRTSTSGPPGSKRSFSQAPFVKRNWTTSWSLTSVLPSQPAWTSRSWSRNKATHVLALCSWRKYPRQSWTSLKLRGGGEVPQGQRGAQGCHPGHHRIWGGQWRKKWTTMEIPSWAQEAKPGQLAQLEKCTRPYRPDGDFHGFCRFTEEELADQVRLGTRPAEDTIVKMFWAPGGEGWHWHRGVTSSNFAALVQRLAHAATLKDIYGIWQQMPLAAQPPSRGQKNKEKMHAELRDFKSAIKEASSFCRELGIKSLRHLDADSFRQVCREMGKFLAAQTFLTHCPAIVMDLPTAAIHDSKAHLRERAICDERISLPLSAFKDLDTIYPKLRAQFGSHNAMVEVKMNWRCTNEIWWCALVARWGPGGSLLPQVGLCWCWRHGDQGAGR